MNKEDAGHIAGMLCEHWPHPILSDDGLTLLVLGIIDSELTRAQAEYAIRCLMQTHRYRPGIPDLKDTAKPTTPLDYHRPYLVPTPAETDSDTVRTHIAAWRTALRRDGS